MFKKFLDFITGKSPAAETTIAPAPAAIPPAATESAGFKVNVADIVAAKAEAAPVVAEKPAKPAKARKPAAPKAARTAKPKK